MYSRNQVAEIQDICSSITESIQKVDAMKKELQSLKKVRICSSCGAEQNNSVAYCSKCGAKLVEEVKAEVVEDIESSEEEPVAKEDSVEKGK